MNALSSAAVDYVVNSAWMCPLVAAVAWVLSRVAARIGVALQHRIWVAALWLQALLPACSLQLEFFRHLLPMLWPWHREGVLRDGMVTVATGPAHVRGFAMREEFAWVLLAIYACVVMYFAARMMAGLWFTHNVTRRATAIDATTSAGYRAMKSSYGFAGKNILTVESADVAAPAAVGISNSLILLPKGWLHEVSADDMNAAIAHECAHVRRHDFAKNLLYRLLSLPLAYHPVAHLTLGRIAETREMVCDAMARTAIRGTGESYVRSLLRLAALTRAARPSKTLYAIGILDANTLERRVMRLTMKQFEAGRALRVTAAAACLAIGAVTCASAMALRIEVAGVAANSEQKKANSAPIKVPSAVVAGNVLYQKPPVYPADARANHDTLNGPVVMDAVIGKDGTIESLRIKQSLRQDYDQSALEAVKEWRYKPYLLNGEPVEVEVTITVNFQIGEKK